MDNKDNKSLYRRVERIKQFARGMGFIPMRMTPDELNKRADELIDKCGFCEENYDPIGALIYTTDLAFFLMASAPLPYIDAELGKDIDIEHFRDSIEKAEIFLSFLFLIKSEEKAIAKMREVMCGMYNVRKMITDAVVEAGAAFPKDKETRERLEVEGSIALEKMQIIWKDRFYPQVNNDLAKMYDEIVENKSQWPSYHVVMLLIGTMIYSQCRLGLMIPLKSIVEKIGGETLAMVSGINFIPMEKSPSPDEYLSEDSINRLADILGKLD